MNKDTIKQSLDLLFRTSAVGTFWTVEQRRAVNELCAALEAQASEPVASFNEFEELERQAEQSLDMRPEFRKAIANAHAAIIAMKRAAPACWGDFYTGRLFTDAEEARQYNENCYELTPLYAAPQPSTKQAEPSGKREVVAKIDKAIKTVSDLCEGRIKWTMRVPAEPDRDPDLIIADALQSAKDALTRCDVAPEAEKQETQPDLIAMIVDRDTPPDNRNEVVDWDIEGKPITRGELTRINAAASDAPAQPQEQQTAEEYLRGKNDAYRGQHYWHDLEEAFNVGESAPAIRPMELPPLPEHDQFGLGHSDNQMREYAQAAIRTIRALRAQPAEPAPAVTDDLAEKISNALADESRKDIIEHVHIWIKADEIVRRLLACNAKTGEANG